MCKHELRPISIEIPNCSLSTVQYCEKCQCVIAWSTKDSRIMKSDNSTKIVGKPRRLSTQEKEALA